MQVEWDARKCRANFEKHGLSFEDACQIFVGDTVTIPDARHDYGEDRLITLGRLEGRVVVVVHVARGEKTRIIGGKPMRGSKKSIKSDLVRIDALKDEDIDYSDIPDLSTLGKEFWDRAIVKLAEPKAQVTLRLDREVLDWFKSQGKGYQTRINAVLRAYKEAQGRA
jgi:uncharacterized DUF497 family protein/uncharacterized protein (DUF4415 family)